MGKSKHVLGVCDHVNYAGKKCAGRCWADDGVARCCRHKGRKSFLPCGFEKGCDGFYRQDTPSRLCATHARRARAKAYQHEIRGMRALQLKLLEELEASRAKEMDALIAEIFGEGGPAEPAGAPPTEPTEPPAGQNPEPRAWKNEASGLAGAR